MQTDLKWFDGVMVVARHLQREKPEALKPLRHSLLMYLQAEAIVNVFSQPSEYGLSPSTTLFPILELCHFFQEEYESFVLPMKVKKPLRLYADVLLVWPWSSDRFTRILKKITGAEWVFDRHNHSTVDYWPQLGCAWVHSGNHSMTAGILNRTGELPVYQMHAITPLFKLMSTDGQDWYVTYGAKEHKLCAIRSIVMAAIFEISKMLNAFETWER